MAQRSGENAGFSTDPRSQFAESGRRLPFFGGGRFRLALHRYTG